MAPALDIFKASDRRRLPIVFAGLLAATGVALTWRALGPSAFRAEPPNDGPETTRAEAAAYPLPRGFPDVVTADALTDQVDTLMQRLKFGIAEFAAAAQLDAESGASLEVAAREMYEIFLGGSVSAYVRHLERLSAQRSLLQQTGDERAEQERIWRLTGEGVARRPVSISEAIVRPRFIRGQEIPQQDLGPRLFRRPPAGRYAITQLSGADPIRSRLTIVEFVVPVMYRWPLEKPRAEGPVWFGFWLVLDNESREWLPWGTILYDCAGIGPDVAPMI